MAMCLTVGELLQRAVSQEEVIQLSNQLSQQQIPDEVAGPILLPAQDINDICNREGIERIICQVPLISQLLDMENNGEGNESSPPLPVVLAHQNNNTSTFGVEKEEVDEEQVVPQSNSPEITEEDVQEVARSLMSSFTAFVAESTLVTVECRDVATSTDSLERRTVGTATNASPVRKSVHTSPRRISVKEVGTEVEFEQLESPSSPASVAFGIENRENIPLRGTGSRLPLDLLGNSNASLFESFLSRTVPNSFEEQELLRLARKHALTTDDRSVPQSKRRPKQSSHFRGMNAAIQPDFPIARTPSNVRFYDPEYVRESTILECDPEVEEEDNEGIVPAVNLTAAAPPCPYLRLGLSRRAKPRRPLHENVLMDY